MSATATQTPSKTAFILGLPHDLPAADVVAKGKEVGLELSDKYVYNIRSSAKRKTSPGAPRKKPGPKPKAASPAQTTSPATVSKPSRSASGNTPTSAESRFVDLALDLGLGRAEEILSKLRAKLRSISF